MDPSEQSFVHALGLPAAKRELPGPAFERVWPELSEAVYKRLHGHGDFSRWWQAILSLPGLNERSCVFHRDAPRVTSTQLDSAENTLVESLRALGPWKKGPFEIGETFIDSEWRSCLKWRRVQDFVSSLQGKTVLDVGTGNGYFLYRAHGDGARLALGLDPSAHYSAQFMALQRLFACPGVSLLPLTSSDFQTLFHGGPCSTFDVVFSMGVLYHRRCPLDHLAQLCSFARRGGEVVVETIVTEGGAGYSLVPQDRYAGMRNVWFLPSTDTLVSWLKKLRLKNIRVSPAVVTTCEEQRATAWSTGHSLKESLDPSDPSRTVEGYPAPRRVLVVGETP